MVSYLKQAKGLEKESFYILFEFSDPGERSCELKYYDNAKEIAQKLYAVTKHHPDILYRSGDLDQKWISLIV